MYLNEKVLSSGNSIARKGCFKNLQKTNLLFSYIRKIPKNLVHKNRKGITWRFSYGRNILY